MAFVVVEEKGQQVLRLELRGPTMGIGRDESNDIRLENRALSRKHAQLEVRGSTVWIRDLGSQNGTFINGERLDGARAIRAGDTISLGGKFELRLEGVEEAKASTPVLTLTGPEGSHRFAMVGEEIVIGRSPDCDISIGRKSISRRHLRVLLKDGKFFAEDLGSQNGTRVNGERIRGMNPVGPDDEIRISEYTIKVGYLEQGGEMPLPPTQERGPSAADSLLEEGSRPDLDEVDPPPPVEVRPPPPALEVARAAQPGGAQVRPPEWAEGDERVETVGIASSSVPSPRTSGALKAPQLGRPGPRTTPASAATLPPPGLRSAAPKEAVLEISHVDGTARNVRLKREVVLCAEDGSESAPPQGTYYAPMAYLAFVPGPHGWLVVVLGDRRFPEVSGLAAPMHTLQNGDVVQLGGLKVIFREV